MKRAPHDYINDYYSRPISSSLDMKIITEKQKELGRVKSSARKFHIIGNFFFSLYNRQKGRQSWIVPYSWTLAQVDNWKYQISDKYNISTLVNFNSSRMIKM